MGAEEKLRIFELLTVAAQPKPQVLRSRCLPWRHISLIRFLRAGNITMFLERERGKVFLKKNILVRLVRHFAYNVSSVYQEGLASVQFCLLRNKQFCCSYFFGPQLFYTLPTDKC